MSVAVPPAVDTVVADDGADSAGFGFMLGFTDRKATAAQA